MLAKTLVDKHIGAPPDLTMAIAGVLADQVRYLDADVVQVDEANLPGSPDEWSWAAGAINCVLDAVKTVPAVHLCFGNYGGQSIQKGEWALLMSYLNAYTPTTSCWKRHTGPPRNWPSSLNCGRRSALAWV